MSRHILSVLVNNQAGVLSRVSSLFSRRGFNIDSLAVGTTQHQNISRMTIVVNGDGYTVDQVTKQLNKLVDIIKIEQLEKDSSVSRELALFKVKATPENRAEIVQMVEIFRANIVDVSKDNVTIEITGGKNKVKAFEELINDFGILETVRTGLIAISRGDNIINTNNDN